MQLPRVARPILHASLGQGQPSAPAAALPLQYFVMAPLLSGRCRPPCISCALRHSACSLPPVLDTLSGGCSSVNPNIFPCGTVCLSILNDEYDWQPGISMQQILSGIQAIKPGHHLPPLPPPCHCPFSTLPDPRICWTRQIYCLQLKNPPTGSVHCDPLLHAITHHHGTPFRCRSYTIDRAGYNIKIKQQTQSFTPINQPV